VSKGARHARRARRVAQQGGHAQRRASLCEARPKDASLREATGTGTIKLGFLRQVYLPLSRARVPRGFLT
jgi:hypothetical protein